MISQTNICQKNTLLALFSSDGSRVPVITRKTWIFRVLEVRMIGEMSKKGKLNKAFLPFCHFFGIFDDFSKWSAMKKEKALQNFLKNQQICQKFGK